MSGMTTPGERSGVYALLAHAFAPPESAEAPAAWGEVLAGLPASLREEVERLATTANSNGDLVRAYQRLFVGPARPRVYPFESCYRDPTHRLAGPWAAQVAMWYAAEGLAPAGPLRQEAQHVASTGSGHRLLPDHIAAELAFMAYLAHREADAQDTHDQSTARRYREQQAAFLQQHLLVWVPEFCRRLLSESGHPFYAALARVLSTWLEVEAIHLGLREAAEPEPAYPVTVVARLCTLCGVCAEACPMAALRLTWVADEARLLLEPDGCTGCRLCADVCPFKALRLGHEPVTGVLVRSPLLPCPDCGRPALPFAFWQRLTRRLQPSDPAAVAARRCPACKESAVLGLASDKHRGTCLALR